MSFPDTSTSTGGTETGYQFESLDDSHHLWLRQPLGSLWAKALRYDRDLTHTENEVGLQYRVDDYVGLEMSHPTMIIGFDHRLFVR